MTPPQPQQHCMSEIVCYRFMQQSPVAYNDKTPCMRNHAGCKPCEFDTRSRPATTPAPCPQYKIWQHCPVAGDIAAKAREDALNDVREALSHIRFQEEDMWFIEAAIKKIEFLRSKGGRPK